jgi:Domain of unknown function (DUF4112)
MDDRHLKVAKKITELLDNKFEIFGIKFGIDPIIGFVPVIGDILPIGLTGYLIWIGYRQGLPKEKLFKMAGFAGLDLLIGFVPFVGDFADIFYRSHKRAMDIIDQHIASFESRVLEGEKIGNASIIQ